MSISEYVTTNVAVKPVSQRFCRETNHGYTVVSRVCSR